MNPYKKQPDHSFWSRAIAKKKQESVDPIVSAPFLISKNHKIATAGSCFAQHIAHRLIKSGFNYLITENYPHIIPSTIAQEYGYGNFTARFGNIYTSRQLLQLLDRAYGNLKPLDDMWVEDDGSIIDPFRPQLTPGGYRTSEEFEYDRRQHFAAVRQMCEEVQVFVFTLGLTETWVDKRDGVAYPVCPGTAAGTFNDKIHEFINLEFEDVVADMSAFIERLSAINRTVKVILTVSPVPLVATATNEHVLVATTFSKSVLRAAAHRLSRYFDNVFYFPSYEIITGSFNCGKYYAEDRREVTPEGVNHVMKLFFKHYCNIELKFMEVQSPKKELINNVEDNSEDPSLVEASALADILCDEEMLDS